ncbi:DUF2946 domain-containing protein, partial [Burkholderia gladioli]|uniref:DUF2946 domain-containing protein n=2 Tax=Burkholderia gladioli TaxID=28095 RepID=UPI0006499467|nr:DUF2946 domain-containing protein [Burkholderia gladioli]MDA0576285.1 DUF2946 domain-containing protein [Burkholderia gladioli]MDA0604357.1 DUF2946 domain-containing protein [Burkholderia gladioli]
MTPRIRIRVTAWLGLLAMWLIVLVPLASQLVTAERASDPVAVAATALCGTSTLQADTAYPRHGDPLAACGYCDLLADHLALPAAPPLPPTLVLIVALAVLPALCLSFTPPSAFAPGRPRAPPHLA